MSDHGEGAWLPGMRRVTHVPADSLRPQSANLHSGDEVWVRGKFLRYRDDGKIAVQLYPNDQNFFTAEQVKQALLASGHSSKHAIVLKDELNGLLAAAAPKPADLDQEQTHFCQNTKQIELTSLSACSCVEPDATPAPACEALTGYQLAGCADRAGLVVYTRRRDGHLPMPGDWDNFAAEVRALAASVPPPRS